MKAFTKGDWEGFFAVSLDAMMTLIVMQGLLTGFLGFPGELVFGRIMPAVAVGLVIGNGFYAWQALRLARAEGRDDVCAIPFGASIITVVVNVFLVMYPVQQGALAAGNAKEAADLLAWHVGLWACVGSGLVEFCGAFVVHHIRRFTPRIVLLVSVAGTALVFLSLDLVFRTFAYPVIGFTALALILTFFFGNQRLRLPIPSGAAVLLVGTGLAWLLHALGLPSVVPGAPVDFAHLGLNLPRLEAVAAWDSLGLAAGYLPIVLPFGFIFLLSGLQNIESAAAAGDSYAPRPLLMMNGIGSLAAAAFGSPFPNSVYVGHPGYKRMGARAGYSTMSAIFWTLVCFTGSLTLITYAIPVEAVMPMIIWIGIVVCAQSFEAAERRHMPAVVMGLLPALAAYIALAVKHALTVTGIEAQRSFFDQATVDAFATMRGFHADGMFALAQGYIYTGMLLAAITFYVIEKRFQAAAAWAAGGAALAATGFIHRTVIRGGDVVGVLEPPFLAWNQWVAGYLLMAAVFLIVPRLSRTQE
ncbi:hypothetical protein [Sphingomonas sp.]|uniref:hypothetical protein n=1 Tax=Sphingomonas sp. TaxID=28214 RepID=UPI001B00393F|nr:hypothetical protein [Sphingomonas sp.]MBO9711658.1 hypothetical protein [Sphingomonas sp.]